MQNYIVYVDQVFLANLFINYLILWLTGLFSEAKSSFFRLLLGAATGSFYSLALFLPGSSSLFSIPLKLLFSLLMILVSFAPLPKPRFLSCLGIFYLISFSLGGFLLGFLYFLNNTAGITVSQDLTAIKVYFWPGLLLAFLAAWLVCRAGAQILFRRFQRLYLQVPLKISLAGTEVELTGLMDTGNSLIDPLTGSPVIIVEYKALSKTLPEEMKKFLESGFTENKFNVRELETNSWATRLRLIPYRSLGQNNGFLIGLKPDRVEVYREEQTIVIEKVIIGIYLNRLNSGNTYQAILHPNLLAVA